MREKSMETTWKVEILVLSLFGSITCQVTTHVHFDRWHTYTYIYTHTWRNRGLLNERNSRDFAVVHVTSCFTKLAERTSLFSQESKRAIVIQVRRWVRRHRVKVNRVRRTVPIAELPKEDASATTLRVREPWPRKFASYTRPSWYLPSLPSCSGKRQKNSGILGTDLRSTRIGRFVINARRKQTFGHWFNDYDILDEWLYDRAAAFERTFVNYLRRQE